MLIARGQVIALTSGQHSDYCLRDHVRALRDFDTDAVVSEFMATPAYLKTPSHPHEDVMWWRRMQAEDRFFDWLIRNGFVEPLPSGEVIEWWFSGCSDDPLVNSASV